MRLLFLCVLLSPALATSSSLLDRWLNKPKATQTIGVRDSEFCRACETGPCAPCNDACFTSATGACAACWAVNPPTDIPCLSIDPNVTSCLECYQENPCYLCSTGSCARCQACRNSTTGDCASCWEPDSMGFSCLNDHLNNTAVDWDCNRCWEPKSPPVIFLSGLTASTLMGSWTKTLVCNDTTKDPQVVWPLSSTSLDTLAKILCYTRVTSIGFDSSTATFTQPKGVDIETIPGLDGLTFGEYVEGIMAAGGYRVGVNLFGAPFDWRFENSGLEQIGFYASLKNLTEQVHKMTGGQRVTYFCPSYGGQVMMGFFARMTQEWKDNYVSWFVADSPVWSGAPVSAYELASLTIRQIAWQWPSVPWLTPFPGTDNYTWGPDEAIICTPDKNYTAADLPQLALDVGIDQQYAEMLTSFQKQSDYASFPAPMVNTYVAYGSTTPTPANFYYNASLVKGQYIEPYKVTNGPGDGIVPLRSSLRSAEWAQAHAKAGYRFIQKDYKEMAHAACFAPTTPASLECFNDVWTLILYGHSPRASDPEFESGKN